MPAVMLLVVLGASVLIVALLAVVLWLSLTDGSPGDPRLIYTLRNFAEVFSDPRTFSVLLDTLGFSGVALVVALAFGIRRPGLRSAPTFPPRRFCSP